VLFSGGSHDNPQNMPDKYDEPTYGQGVANLQGTAGATPANQPFTTFTENKDMKTLLGGRDEIQAIEEMNNSYGSAANAPLWLQATYSGLNSMFGSSATGSGQLSVGINGTGKDCNNQEIVGASGVSGQEYQYTQLDAAATEFSMNYANAISNGSSPKVAYYSATALTAPPPQSADVNISYQSSVDTSA
jgi:hypothetical protein